MMRRMVGFGLIEALLALVLGLVITLALTQLFIGSKRTYLSQAASAALQEDARFVLSKMAEDIRLVGMFGCLHAIRDESQGGRFSEAFNAPLRWNASQRSLTMVTATIDPARTWHDWVIQTDCTSSAAAWSRGRAPSLLPGQMAMPIGQHVYRFNARRNELTLNGQPLLSHVRDFTVLFGEADGSGIPRVARYISDPDPARVRSVRLSLVLFDPSDRVRDYTFHAVAAIRNRLN